MTSAESRDKSIERFKAFTKNFIPAFKEGNNTSSGWEKDVLTHMQDLYGLIEVLSKSISVADFLVLSEEQRFLFEEVLHQNKL